MQNAFGRLAASAGVDLFPQDYAELSNRQLASILEARYAQLTSGDLPLQPPKTQAQIEAERLANQPPPPPPPVWTPERQRALNEQRAAEAAEAAPAPEPAEAEASPAPEAPEPTEPQSAPAAAPVPDNVWTPEKQRRMNEQRAAEQAAEAAEAHAPAAEKESNGWWVFSRSADEESTDESEADTAEEGRPGATRAD
jgi:hypothetical protein